MMNRLVLALAALLCSAPCYGQITKIQHANASADNAVSSVNVSAITSGSAVIATVFWCDNIGCNASITGETAAVTATGCTFEEALSGENTGSFRVLKTFVANNCSGGATQITSTITGGSDTFYHQVLVSEYSGIATMDPVEPILNTDTVTEGTNPDISTNGATGQNDELVYAAIVAESATVTAGDPTFTEMNDLGSVHDQYKVVPSTGVQTAEWTIDGSVEVIMNILALKAAVGAGGGGGGHSGGRPILRLGL